MIPTEPQTTDLLSYVNVPGAIDLHIKAYNVYFHFEVKVLLKQKFRLVNTFQCTQNHETYYCEIVWFFFLNYTCIYNRKFMRFIILQLDEFTCTIYPTVLFFLQIFVVTLTSANYSGSADSVVVCHYIREKYTTFI